MAFFEDVILTDSIEVNATRLPVLNSLRIAKA